MHVGSAPICDICGIYGFSFGLLKELRLSLADNQDDCFTGEEQ